MKLTQLKAIIDGVLERRQSWDELTVRVLLAEPSMGPRASTDVVSAHPGIDWEKGSFMLQTEARIARKSQEQDAFDAARDLLMHLATKPAKRESYETRTAKSILKRVGYTDEQFEKYRHLFHEEKPRHA